MNEIRPIETIYNDYRFRSRLEARWAVFFDAIGIRWEYEKEGFDLGQDGRYLPDFFIPSHDLWIEIKGEDPFSPITWQYKDKRLERFSQDKFLLVFHGLPLANYGCWFGQDATDSAGGEMYWIQMEWCIHRASKEIRISTHDCRSDRSYYTGDDEFTTREFIIQEHDAIFQPQLIIRAALKAKQARFEHFSPASQVA